MSSEPPVCMRPSDITLASPMPLTGTFGSAEGEQMAALMISTLASLGDDWRPVLRSEIAETIRGWIKSDSAPGWTQVGPFFRPDARRLEAKGYAVLDGQTIAFTEKGLVALRSSTWSGT